MQQPTEMQDCNSLLKNLLDTLPKGIAKFDFVVSADEIEINTAFANTQQSIHSKD